MSLKLVCALFFFYFLQTVRCASILALFSSLSFTDHFVFRGYISLLAQRGHSIVVMTPYAGHFQPPEAERIIEINVGPESAPMWDEYKALMTNVDDHHPHLKALNEHAIKLCIKQLMSKQMTALFINPNVKFDLVITEADMPILYAVAEKYKAPHISITTSSGKIHQYEAKGNPVNPILYPDVNAKNYRNLTSRQKLSELYRQYQTKYEYYNYFLPLCEVAAQKILGLKRSLLEVEYDIDLLFVASNPALIGNRPSAPATVYTDRLHLKPGLPLPMDLKSLLDSATNGVVYFSLGTIQDSEQLAPKLLDVLVEAFKELPYLVLWKMGNTTMINKPDNVIAQSWFPQQEVLAHPNVKAFITHGGLRSLEEALFYEVPVIGLPILKYKKVFINEVTRHGTGEILDPYYLDKESLKATVTAVVTNDKYKEAMSRLRSASYDPLLSGPERALWWTEYVIRNGGARFLRSPSVGSSFFEYSMINVISVLLIIIFFIIWIIFIIIRYIIKQLRNKFRQNILGGGKFKAL